MPQEFGGSPVLRSPWLGFGWLRLRDPCLRPPRGEVRIFAKYQGSAPPGSIKLSLAFLDGTQTGGIIINIYVYIIYNMLYYTII